MDYWKACQLLGVDDKDDSGYIKKRYRNLMLQYHPDASGDDPRLLVKTQLINEAYHVISKCMARRETEQGAAGKKEGQEGVIWDVPQNEYAFCGRDIYLSKAFYEDYRLDGYKIAKGKYFWDAEREDFKHLLLSLNQLCSDRLEEIERKYGVYNVDEYGLSSQQAAYKAKIFHLLVQQFIDPSDSLHKTYRIEDTDREGRSIFLFPASVGIRGTGPAFDAARKLQPGDPLYPMAIQDNRIQVCDSCKTGLGYVSFEDDRLYYMVIPALSARIGTVKLRVRGRRFWMNSRPMRAKVDLDFYLKLEQEEEFHYLRKSLEEERNRTIRRFLMEYESYIRGITGSRQEK